MKNLLLGAAAIAALAIVSPAIAQPKPSFNCSYAKTPDEVLICENPNLADMDVQLANFFYHLRNQMSDRMRQQMDADEAAWLRERRACGRDPVCIALTPVVIIFPFVARKAVGLPRS